MPTSDQLDPTTLKALDELVPGAADFFEGQDNAQAMALIKQAMDQFGNINAPTLQKLILQQMGPSAFQKIQDNPQYLAEQKAADANLQDVINGGGLTLADRAALDSIRQKNAITESAGRNAITQGMAARGTLDSGAQLAAELGNSQAADTNLNQMGESDAGQAQLRAFQAIQQRASNAASGLSREQQLAMARAQAEDAISAMNTNIANMANVYNTETLPQTQFQDNVTAAEEHAKGLELGAGAYGAQAKDQASQNVRSDAANAIKSVATFEGAPSAAKGITSGQEPGNDLSGSTSQAESGASTKPSGNSAQTDPLSGQQPQQSAQGQQPLSGASTLSQDDGYVQVGYDGNGQPIFHKRNGLNSGTGGRNF